MSTDLETRLVKKFSVRELIDKASGLLSQILSVDHEFHILMDYDHDLIALNESRTFLVCTLEEPDDIVELCFLFHEPVPGFEDPSEDGWWGSATIRASRNAPMKYALAAALVIALSELNDDGEILDDNRIWHKERSVERARFFHSIRVSEQAKNTDEALKEFVKGLNQDVASDW